MRSKCAPAGSIRSPSRPLARNLPTRVRHSSTVCYSAGRRQLSPTRDHTAHGDVLVCLRWPAHDSSINVVVLPAISGAEPPSDAHVQVVPTKVGGARTTCPRPVLHHLHPALTELFKSTRTRIARVTGSYSQWCAGIRPHPVKTALPSCIRICPSCSAEGRCRNRDSNVTLNRDSKHALHTAFAFADCWLRCMHGRFQHDLATNLASPFSRTLF